MVLVLFETPAGYAVFKVTDKGLLSDPQNIYKSFETPDKASSVVKLKAFRKFEDTSDALAAATAVCDGALDTNLSTFLSELLAKEKDGKLKLGVSDPKLGSLIKEKVAGVKCLYDTAVSELIRGIRAQSSSLLSGLKLSDSDTMRLGLAHSLCRYKLKFSPDKVDVMIIQAISLLDELDKELNTYAMRVREWYGWHFPEMGKIVTDNMQYAKCVQAMSVRVNAATTDFSNILTEDVETSLKEASKVSMGTDIAEEDVTNIKSLCGQVIKISEYRASLFEYLKNRMSAIAPNLTVMVGELVGARLIAHAGSLLSLAKAPASTVQILGAEKALFRALKTKHDTPKYGLIYHASLVGQAAPKLKGKVSRMLAAKTALACRADALGEADAPNIAIDNRSKVEMRIRQLEGGKASSLSSQTPKKQNNQEKYVAPKSAAKTYNNEGDNAMDLESDEAKAQAKAAKKEAKRKAKEAAAAAATATNVESESQSESSTKEKKKEKRKRQEEKPEAEVEAESIDAQKEKQNSTSESKSEKKKDKKKKQKTEE